MFQQQRENSIELFVMVYLYSQHWLNFRHSLFYLHHHLNVCKLVIFRVCLHILRSDVEVVVEFVEEGLTRNLDADAEG